MVRPASPGCTAINISHARFCSPSGLVLKLWEPLASSPGAAAIRSCRAPSMRAMFSSSYSFLPVSGASLRFWFVMVNLTAVAAKRSTTLMTRPPWLRARLRTFGKETYIRNKINFWCSSLSSGQKNADDLPTHSLNSCLSGQVLERTKGLPALNCLDMADQRQNARNRGPARIDMSA